MVRGLVLPKVPALFALTANGILAWLVLTCLCSLLLLALHGILEVAFIMVGIELDCSAGNVRVGLHKLLTQAAVPFLFELFVW